MRTTQQSHRHILRGLGNFFTPVRAMVQRGLVALAVLMALLLVPIMSPSVALAGAGTNRLNVNETLYSNQSMYSNLNSNRLIMQSDGNLVLYGGDGRARWWTGTGVAGSRLILQSDGNLVIYTLGNVAVWSTQTGTASFLLVQDDQNVVLYDWASRAVWASGSWASSGQWCADVFWTTWWATSTSTVIEPHMLDYAYPGIGRYTGSGVVYYYGPAVTNSLISHNKSSVAASNGTYIGNYFRHQGIRFSLPSNSC